MKYTGITRIKKIKLQNILIERNENYKFTKLSTGWFMKEFL